jgi:hypothetical protein
MFFNSTPSWRKRRARAQRQMFPRRRPVTPRLEVLEDRTLPSTFLVTDLSDHGPGSLRTAVQSADANPGSTIDFAPGLHGTITLTSGQLNITSSTTLNDPSANKLAVSGNNAGRIFDISGSASVSISGLTLTDGLATRGAASCSREALPSASATAS